MIKINLVPAEILDKARQKDQAIEGGAAAAAVLFLLILLSMGHYFKLKSLHSRVAKDDEKLKKLQVIVAKVQELESTASAVRARLNVINDLLKNRPLYPYFMSDFAKNVPSGVQVKTLNTVGGGSAGTPLKLTIAAQAQNNEDIAAWVRNLEASGKFASVDLGAVTVQNQDRLKVYNFSLISVYTPTF